MSKKTAKNEGNAAGTAAAHESSRQKALVAKAPALQAAGGLKEMVDGSPRLKQLKAVQAMADAGKTLKKETARPALAAGGMIVQRQNDELVHYLANLDYIESRNYMSWGGEDTEHVGWKAHVGAAAGEALAIAQKAAFLRENGISHKFDISDNAEKPISKFITVYPPEFSGDWKKVIYALESRLKDFASTDIEGDMRVMSDSPLTARAPKVGKVFMRHGQNTPLLLSMVADRIKPAGKLGKYNRYTGADVQSDLPLLEAGKKLFFPKDGKEPAELNPGTVYMAIDYGGKIVPDKREEPNPANAPLPPGISGYSDDHVKKSNDLEEEQLNLVGSLPEDPSPLALAVAESENEDYEFNMW